MFHFVEKSYKPQNTSILQKKKRDNTVHFGSESLSSLAPK